MTACPCGGATLAACCGPFLDGHPAPTAEQVMRSRYSAYALRNENHLFRTWHPRTRPKRVTAGDEEWLSLQVVRTVDGGPDDRTGVVEFVAEHTGGRMHAVSRFERRGGRWMYTDDQD